MAITLRSPRKKIHMSLRLTNKEHEILKQIKDEKGFTSVSEVLRILINTHPLVTDKKILRGDTLQELVELELIEKILDE